MGIYREVAETFSLPRTEQGRLETALKRARAAGLREAADLLHMPEGDYRRGVLLRRAGEVENG